MFRRAETARASLERWTDPALATLSALFTLGVVLAYRPWNQATGGDIALFQAFGRLVAHGAVPYRDFFDQKTPLTEYANAPVALLSGWFRFDYVLGARGLSIALFAAGGAVIYLLSRACGLERVPSFGAVALFSAFDFFAWNSAVGLEPKQLTSLVGIAGLLAAYRRHWLAAGLLCGLAFLAWQPGGVVLLGAASRALLTERGNLRRSIGPLLAGFLLPVVAMLVYFAAVGALNEFWGDTVTFNRSYVGDPPWPPPFDRALDIINASYGSDRWLFLLGSLGFFGWLAAAGWSFVRGGHLMSFAGQAPMAIVTAGSLGYTAVHLGDLADIIPFVPLVAFWTAWLLAITSRLSASHARELSLAGLVVLVAYGQRTVVDQGGLQQPGITLAWQRQQVLSIQSSALVDSGDPLYIVNTPWFLLLADHKDLGRYYYLWNGVDRFAIRQGHGDGVLTQPIVVGQPKLVVVGEGAKVFESVLRQNYVQVDPASLPDYRFPGPAEFWIRRDVVAAGATAKLLPAVPVPLPGELCRPSDLGAGYSVLPTLDQGWVDRDHVRGIERQVLDKIGYERGYTALFGSDATRPTLVCAASIFLRPEGGRNWIKLARQHVCATCRQLTVPAELGNDALLTIGSGAATTSDGYAASLLVSRDYLLVGVTAELPGGSAADDDTLAALVEAQARKMLDRFQ